MRNDTHCAGCGQKFETYGMDRSEGFEVDGLAYCNSDCELESGVRDLEHRELESLSDDY